MFERIGGLGGIAGLVATLGGIGLVATQDPLIAGGIGLVIVGLGLLLRGVVQGVLAAMGMDGML